MMLWSTCVALATAAAVSAEVLITYPGTRGNNFITNSDFPYSMQSEYPCGGIPATKNRTYWPTVGGAVAFQPGWLRGGDSNLLYINLGEGTEIKGGPKNMSLSMVQQIQITGPSLSPIPGTICFPQVPLPANVSAKAGDLATIQVVELPMHGAARYQCVDIIFADPGDSRIAEVNENNCYNSQELAISDVYTITTTEPRVEQTSGADSVTFWYLHRHQSYSTWRWMAWLPAVLGGLWIFL